MGEKEIFCSVIIPVYNTCEYIERCIKSVLSQTYSNFELVLIDDGSTDNSGEICQRYALLDDRITFIQKENGGHTSARNAGLKVAKGEYVTFVDSDDWIDSGLLNDCYEVIKNSKVDIVLFGYRRTGLNTIMNKPQPFRKGMYNREQIEQEILPYLLTSARFSLSERMVKKELVIEKQKYVDERLKLGEDLTCCVLALNDAKAVYVLDNIYYNYFQRENSVAHSYKNYTFENWDILKNILNQNLNKLVNLDIQLGVCSIRFLDRAVLGEIEREGLSFSNIYKIKKKLKDYQKELNAAEIKNKKALQFKLFCLKYHFVYLLYFASSVNNKLR